LHWDNDKNMKNCKILFIFAKKLVACGFILLIGLASLFFPAMLSGQEPTEGAKYGALLAIITIFSGGLAMLVLSLILRCAPPTIETEPKA
jgi:hypothetical protein